MPGVNPYTNVNAAAQIGINFPASSPPNKVQVTTVSRPSNSNGLGYGALDRNNKFRNAVEAAAGRTPPPKPESPPEPSAGDPDSNPDTADAVEIESLEAAGVKFDPTKQDEKSEAKPGIKAQADGEDKPAVPGRAGATPIPNAPRQAGATGGAKPAQRPAPIVAAPRKGAPAAGGKAAAAAGNQPKAPTMQNYYQALRKQLRLEYNKNGLSLSSDRLKTFARRFKELSQNPNASPALQKKAGFISTFLGLAASSQDIMKAAQSGDPKQFKAALNNHLKNYLTFLKARQALLKQQRANT